ncbi:hypothetical protein M405DRAFT_921688 [Rhizopogon salebrosus TDB-379]|nr:hypothetical protein M405DRAFT_921688 [Rhizopogon salebrosus TDB-379]
MEGESFVQGGQADCETYSHQRQREIRSLPACTRTLSISELRWKIFELIWASESSRKKTLLALALTCKSFTGPALDLLWRELNGFDPLIRCLPPSLWKIDKQELKLQRAMTFDDWTIFRKYNYRVSSLNTVFLPFIRVGTEIWGALSCPPFPLPLLPNLTSLTWIAPNEAFPCIRSFVTQTLTTLKIHAGYPRFSPGPLSESILSCIPTLCLSVSHFESYGGAESGDASIALQSWSHLISVTIDIVSNAAILHLSNLPSLQELHVELCSMPIDADTQNLLRRPAFFFQPIYALRNLRKLHFEVEHGVQLHDATLMQMGKAWPLLERLAIIAESSTSSLHHITPNGLVSLLQHCPRLSSIHIAMDWSAVDRLDVSPDIPYEGFAHNTLKYADFGSSKIRHATEVAAFISAIAPKLHTIIGWESERHYEDDDYVKYSSRWTAVDHLVKVFLMVREQERRMMLRTIGGTANGRVGS